MPAPKKPIMCSKCGQAIKAGETKVKLYAGPAHERCWVDSNRKRV